MSGKAQNTGSNRTWRSPWLAGAICIAFLVVSALPSINHLIWELDRFAARQLNSVIGTSGVLDHLIVAVADQNADFRIAVILIGSFFLYAAFAPDLRTRASRLSMLVYMIAAVSVGLLLQEALDEIVERRSPAYELRPFRDIERFVDENVKVRTRESFPSPHGIVYFLIGFSLLRAGWWISPVLLGAGVVLPLARCAIGAEWISDVYLGSLPLAFFMSALAMETKLYRGKKALERNILFLLDKSAIYMRRKGHLFDGSFRYSTQNVYRVEASIKRYLKDQGKRYGRADEKAETRIEMPLAGSQSIIRFVRFGENKVVLRVYPLVRRIEAELHRDASEMLARYNINAPRIIDYFDEPRRYNVVFLVEEFLEGSGYPAEYLTETHLRSLAQQLAKLHSIHNRTWGPLRSPRQGKHFPALMKRIDRQLQLATDGEAGIQKNDIPSLLNWFYSWDKDFDKIPHYSLTHNKLHQNNCLFDANGTYFFIDFTTLEWSVPTKDVVKVHTLVCNNDEEKIAFFNQHYFPLLPETDRALIQMLMPFYLAQFHLTAAATSSRRLQRRDADPDSHFGEKREIAVARLLQIATTARSTSTAG